MWATCRPPINTPGDQTMKIFIKIVLLMSHVNGSSEQHEETQLLPHLEPVVQPGGEPGVLGSSEYLDPARQHPGQVAESQGDESVDCQGLVHVVHGDVIPEMP